MARMAFRPKQGLSALCAGGCAVVSEEVEGQRTPLSLELAVRRRNRLIAWLGSLALLLRLTMADRASVAGVGTVTPMTLAADSTPTKFAPLNLSLTQNLTSVKTSLVPPPQ